jgi:hypothetical protein
VTEVAAFSVTVHVELVLPAHAPPDHWKNTPIGDAAADSVTLDPVGKSNTQVAPDAQEIPAGADVTVPVPGSPATLTVSWVVGGGGGVGVNVAVTLCAALMVTAHAPVPVQAPDQPVNVLPDAGVAVSVTTVPVMKLDEQVPGQVIPAGEEPTLPAPATLTFSAWVVTIGLNVAVTLFAASMVTTQVSELPEHAPLQPPNVNPELAVAVSVTGVPATKLAEHRPGQSIGPGDDDTAPPPAPDVPTESTKVMGPTGPGANVAVTPRAALIVTTQLPVPVHAPLQPVKVLAASGAALSVTTVPAARLLVQVPGQSMPPTSDATAPTPVPVVATVSVKLPGGVTGGSNVAVTFCAALTVRLQLPVPEQSPLHPANVLPLVGVALSVTVVPAG